MGTDQVGANTDVLLTLQIKDGTTRLTQVPRDTYIESESHGVLKANALYAVGGVETVKRELSRLLSVPVERYVMVNLDAVQRLAEAVGGVEVDVPKRMFYVDNSQGLYIDLYPGRQLLQGRDLEGFLRFRHDELGDIGRLERQKMVLRQVFSKLADPATVTRLPELLQVAGRDVRTDLSPVELGALVSAMAGTRLSTAALPGRAIWQDDLSYWMPASNPRYREDPEGGEVEAAATAP
jgi:LCP family protein required for cell wall assembly